MPSNSNRNFLSTYFCRTIAVLLVVTFLAAVFCVYRQTDNHKSQNDERNDPVEDYVPNVVSVPQTYSLQNQSIHSISQVTPWLSDAEFGTIDLRYNKIRYAESEYADKLLLDGNPLICSCLTHKKLCSSCQLPLVGNCPKKCAGEDVTFSSDFLVIENGSGGDVVVQTGKPQNIETPNKQFPHDIAKTFTGREWSEMQITCDVDYAKLADKYPYPTQIKWYQYSRWSGSLHTPEPVDQKYIQQPNTLRFAHIKLQQSAMYFCQLESSKNATKVLATSRIILVGFTPNTVLTISFILTTLLTFIATFIINWFDLGKYYCNFIEHRLQKVEQIAKEDFDTPASVRASKASLHYQKYDDKSQSMFISTLMRGASSVRSAIAERAENFEFTVPLRDVRDQIDARMKEVKFPETPKFLEFSIPLPSLFARRESVIMEETEAELEQHERGEQSSPREVKQDGGGAKGPLKRLKSNMSKYAKNVATVRLRSNDTMTPDFLENVSLKFKFSPSDMFKWQGDAVPDIVATNAASRLANSGQYHPQRPSTLSTRPRHNSGGSASGMFTVDVIDDRQQADNGSLKLTSSVVVTPMDESFKFTTGGGGGTSRSMTPTFFVTLDSAVFDMHRESQRLYRSQTSNGDVTKSAETIGNGDAGTATKSGGELSPSSVGSTTTGLNSGKHQSSARHERAESAPVIETTPLVSNAHGAMFETTV